MTYPPALFAYDATPANVPYTSDSHDVQQVTLMITVNNPTAAHVDCSQLVFSLPVGSGNGDLTTNPSAIACSPCLGVPWTISSDDEGSFTAMPQPPATGLDVGDSIAFLLSGVQVNELPGLTMVTVYEATDTVRSALVPVAKVPPGLAITSFTAAPVQVRAGDVSTLSWTTTGASSCTLSWSGQTVPVELDGEHPVRPQSTTTYTLTAVGDSSPITEQITVYVPQVTILSFGAVPSQVAQDGPSTLSWLVNNADTCQLNPGSFSVDPNSGSQVVNPHLSGSYTLTANGFGRTVSMPAPIEVMKVQVPMFTATPSQVPPGAILAATLGWTTSWATACSISPDVGSVPLSGIQSVTPGQTTTYSLAAVGLDPPDARVTVTVCPAVALIELRAAPTTGQLTLLWQVIGGAVTIAMGSSPAQSYPSSGATFLSRPWPSTATITVTGAGMTSTIVLALPGQLGQVTVSSLRCTCGYGINAPGATASLAWDTDGGTVGGSVVAATTQGISGSTGALTVPLGAGQSGRLWSLDFGFGTEPGQRVGMAVLVPGSQQQPQQHKERT